MFFFQQILPSIITVLVSLIASGGFWTYLQKKTDKNSASVQLLRGLAHEKIIALGAKYIDRGWLTMDEYDDFVHYIYGPYSQVGGNGLAEKVFNEVSKLPVYRKALKTGELQIVKD